MNITNSGKLEKDIYAFKVARIYTLQPRTFRSAYPVTGRSGAEIGHKNINDENCGADIQYEIGKDYTSDMLITLGLAVWENHRQAQNQAFSGKTVLLVRIPQGTKYVRCSVNNAPALWVEQLRVLQELG